MKLIQVVGYGEKLNIRNLFHKMIPKLLHIIGVHRWYTVNYYDRDAIASMTMGGVGKIRTTCLICLKTKIEWEKIK